MKNEATPNNSSQTNRDLLLCNPDFLTHELAKKAFFFFTGVCSTSWPNNLKVKKISRIFFNINVDCYIEIWES